MMPYRDGLKYHIKKRFIEYLGLIILGVPFLLVCALTFAFLRRARLKRIGNKSQPRFLLGLSPIINLKYWSLALKNAGYTADTIVWEVPIINNKSDFDFVLLSGQKGILRLILEQYYSYYTALKFFFHYDILKSAFKYSLLDKTPLWKLEGFLHYLMNTKTILHPYGSDAYLYRYVSYPHLRHVLNASIKDSVFQQHEIDSRIRFWERWADFLTTGVMFDGFSRWDALPQSLLLFKNNPESEIFNKQTADGISDAVTIVHSPNFRGFKGTEFIVSIINSLKSEGLKINFQLIENKKNSEVLEILKSADILVEQIICPGYGLNAVEGMSSGCVVISNIAKNSYLDVMRVFSFLDDCPIVEANPSTLKSVLKKLITEPSTRKKISKQCPKYLTDNHSEKSYVRFTEKIVQKIWFKENVDLHFYFTDFNRFS